MKVFISSDHGGFELKKELLEYLKTLNINGGTLEVEDLGPDTLDPNDDYPVYAAKVAKEVQAHLAHGEDVRGVLICRSGIGVTITANKFKDIYAANCQTAAMAKVGREHNNINILCLDADHMHEDYKDIVNAFLESDFSSEERHRRRVQMISDIDAGQIELENVVTDLPINEVPQIRE